MERPIFHPEIVAKEKSEAVFEKIKDVFEKKGANSTEFMAFCDSLEQGFTGIRVSEQEEKENNLSTQLDNLDPKQSDFQQELLRLNRELRDVNKILRKVVAKHAAVNETIRTREESILPEFGQTGYRQAFPEMKNLTDEFVATFKKEQKVHKNEQSATWSALSILSNLRERMIFNTDNS